MRGFCPLTAATLLLVLALAGEALGQDQWQTITAPNGSFTVELPGNPHYAQEELAGAKGTAVIVHKYRVDDGMVTYLAQGATYTDEFGISNPKSFLEDYLKRLAKQLDEAKWNSVKWGTQQGAVTVEAIAVVGETDERFFAAVKGRNGIDLGYFGPRGTATSSDANRFFSSVKIGGEEPQRALPPMGSTPLQRDRP
jgi:hypothetical protein